MSWLYCPVKLRGAEDCVVPSNLKQFSPILRAVYMDAWNDGKWATRWLDKYIYLTVKTRFVTPENPGNRPGWHCDGYGSDDLNYIWSSRNPTLFWELPCRIYLPEDHERSMQLMCGLAEEYPHLIRTYPDKTLLRLDETVIHNVAPCPTPGWRTFVKVSVSSQRYLLEGNSINHELAPDWTYVAREENRNDPLKPLKVGDGHYEA